MSGLAVPLRLRLALLFAAGTALAVGVAGLGFLLQLRISLDATLDTALQARADAVADQLVDRTPAPVPGHTDEEPVQVLSPDGRVLTSTPAATTPLLDGAQLRALASGAGPVTFTATVGGERTRVLGTATVGRVIVVGMGTDISDAASDHVERAFLLGGPLAVLVAGAGAWVLAGAALRPVERMRRQTARISENDSRARVAVPATGDEIAALAVTLNRLLDRLHAALRRERGFVADAGHELRTPLATLNAELELADRPGRDRDELVEAIGAARRETTRLIGLSEDLLLLARADEARPGPAPVRVELAPLLDQSARGHTARAAGHEVTLAVRAGGDLAVWADPSQLRQIVDNLLDNAVRHSPTGGCVELAAAARDTRIEITVRDHGPGFPPDFLPHAFERFSRADTARTRADGSNAVEGNAVGGSGLGLAIVAALARAHQGTTTASNDPDGGARVTVALPRAQ